jgi:hypothetical protein
MLFPNIAIGGPMCSGKTATADAFVERWGYTRISLAMRLKELASQVFGAGQPIDKIGRYPIYPEGNDEGQIVSGRELLQRLGDAPKVLEQDFWTLWLLRDIRDGIYGNGPFVVDDMRYIYEGELLSTRGFTLVGLFVDQAVLDERFIARYGRRAEPSEETHTSERGWWNIIYDFDVTPGARTSSEVAAHIAGLIGLPEKGISD